MAFDRKYVTYAVGGIAIAAIPLAFFGPEGLRLVVIGLLMLAGPGTALVLLPLAATWLRRPALRRA